MIRKLIPLALAAGLALAAAGPASAAVPHVTGVPSVTTTYVTADPDSGNGGTWATDGFTRALAVTPLGTAPAASCGGVSPCYAYSAVISDKGGFTTIPGALAPNQAPGWYAGQLVTAAASGSLTGDGSYGTFYAASLPDPALVPASITGSPDSAAFPSRMFATPVFGLSETAFEYFYAVTTGPGHGQKWADTSANGDGNVRGDGQVTG
jgi:hypothetical protein